MSLLVGVDVGGTTSTVAIGNTDRRLLSISRQFPTRSVEGPRATIEDIVSEIRNELSAIGRSLRDVVSVGLATPGPASLDGVIVKTTNLSAPEWDRFPMQQGLQDQLQPHAESVVTHYIGDGQAAALGEFAVRTGNVAWASIENLPDSSRLKSNSDWRSLFMVAVGTGLGGGEVRDGKPVRGSGGRAGHAGHLMLPADAFRYEHDRQLKVGNAFNTSESAVSLTALTHQLGYRLGLDQWRDHPLRADTGTIGDKAKQLRELAASGDELALQLFDDQAVALGTTLLMINYIGDYDLLVIGGGVCDLADTVRDRYLEIAKKAYHQHALDGFRDLPSLSFSVCGDQASVIGAMVHACDSIAKMPP